MVRWADNHGLEDEVDYSHDGALNVDETANTAPETNRAESLYEGASTTKGSDTDDHSTNQFAGRETAQVFYLRIVVLLVLFLAAGAVSTVVFIVTKKAQEDEFEAEYDGIASKILETFVSTGGCWNVLIVAHLTSCFVD